MIPFQHESGQGFQSLGPRRQRHQRLASFVDELFGSASTLLNAEHSGKCELASLSILAFLLAAAVLHRVEAIAHLSNSLHGHFHHTPITISLEAAAIAGLVISLLLWVLVAIATPIPGLFAQALQQRIPPHIRERIMKNAA